MYIARVWFVTSNSHAMTHGTCASRLPSARTCSIMHAAAAEEGPTRWCNQRPADQLPVQYVSDECRKIGATTRLACRWRHRSTALCRPEHLSHLAAPSGGVETRSGTKIRRPSASAWYRKLPPATSHSTRHRSLPRSAPSGRRAPSSSSTSSRPSSCRGAARSPTTDRRKWPSRMRRGRVPPSRRRCRGWSTWGRRRASSTRPSCRARCSPCFHSSPTSPVTDPPRRPSSSIRRPSAGQDRSPGPHRRPVSGRSRRSLAPHACPGGWTPSRQPSPRDRTFTARSVTPAPGRIEYRFQATDR